MRETFTAEHKQAAKDSPLNAADGEPRFISLLARELAWFQGAGQRATSADKETRDQAARMIDKLLNLRAKGVNPPLIGLLHDFETHKVRFVFLADELERWRDALRAQLPDDRHRREKTDAYLGRRMAGRMFKDAMKEAFGSQRVADALGERFDALIGYKNSA